MAGIIFLRHSSRHSPTSKPPWCTVFSIKAKFLWWHTRFSMNSASHTLFQLCPSKLHLPQTQSALPRPSPCSDFPLFSIVDSYPLFKPTPSGLASAMLVVLHTHLGLPQDQWLSPRTFCQELSWSISSLGCEVLEARACVYWTIRAHLSSRQPMDSTHVFSWMNELQWGWAAENSKLLSVLFGSESSYVGCLVQQNHCLQLATCAFQFNFW